MKCVKLFFKLNLRQPENIIAVIKSTPRLKLSNSLSHIAEFGMNRRWKKLINTFHSLKAEYTKFFS
jgi:hypothetical protein